MTYKRTIINFFKEFKELKKDMKKYLNELKENEFKENKCLSDAPENTNISLMEMMKIIRNLKVELNKTIETSKRTQAEIKMALNFQ